MDLLLRRFLRAGVRRGVAGNWYWFLLAGATFFLRRVLNDRSSPVSILASMAAVEAHEAGLFARLLDGLAKLGDVTVYGQAARRAPTAFFNVGAVGPQAVAEHLSSRGVNVWDGDNYAYELCQVLGLQSEGAVRAGLVHYNDETDVDRLLSGVAEMAAG